jgi:beta-phosphoglucomutase-like phosphatase (HAD superfamily)
VLKILGLEDHFQVIASGDQVKRGKPAPDVFLKAAEMLQCDPGTLLVLEDTAHGVNAARSAGMYCIAVPNRYTVNQDFSGAHRVLPSLKEFNPELIGGLNPLNEGLD